MGREFYALKWSFIYCIQLQFSSLLTIKLSHQKISIFGPFFRGRALNAVTNFAFFRNNRNWRSLKTQFLITFKIQIIPTVNVRNLERTFVKSTTKQFKNYDFLAVMTVDLRKRRSQKRNSMFCSAQNSMQFLYNFSK